MRLKIDNTRCTGCLLCEITCSLIHGGQVQREAAAIRVQFGHLDHDLHRPVVCRQCKKMRCLPGDGQASDDRWRGAFFWDASGRSATDCPFGALFAGSGRLVHCNLCGGDPECVKSCPTGALQFSA